MHLEHTFVEFFVLGAANKFRDTFTPGHIVVFVTSEPVQECACFVFSAYALQTLGFGAQEFSKTLSMLRGDLRFRMRRKNCQQ